jgi:adenylosuccinate synthase
MSRSKDPLVTVVVGAQWGDEGKGKIVHLLSAEADIVMRYQGGANAGHTISINSDTFKCRLIPSGILRDGCTCIIGSGVVVDPIGLVEEIAELKERSAFRGRLMIDRHAELVLPYHKLQDEYSEAVKGDAAIGTTRRGIGPAYADKHFRVGFRAGDTFKPDFRERVLQATRRKNVLFAGYYGKPKIDPEQLWSELAPAVAAIQELIADAVSHVRNRIEQGGVNILLEGAQGVLLDIDDGTYPFVTSSHPGVAGALSGTGISWRNISRVIGITKAYATRVGNGAFPTEQDNAVGRLIGERGKEIGTVTGRIRRCGWLDLPLLEYAAKLNGFTELVVTKLDVFDDFEEIQFCAAHHYPSDNSPELTMNQRPDIDRLADCVPFYRTMPGWQRPTTGCRHLLDLPTRARQYLETIESTIGVPVTMVSVGADTDAVATRE